MNILQKGQALVPYRQFVRDFNCLVMFMLIVDLAGFLLRILNKFFLLQLGKFQTRLQINNVINHNRL